MTTSFDNKCQLHTNMLLASWKVSHAHG